MNPQTTNWYVATTMPRAEKKVGMRLTALGYENLVPMHKQLRTWSDRKKFVEMPLFSSYAFVHTTERLRSDTFKAGGIVRYLSLNGQPAILRPHEIERIKKLCDFEGDIIITGSATKVNDEVIINAGVLCGIRGILISDTGRAKVRISIPGLGCFAQIEIGREMVQKINVI